MPDEASSEKMNPEKTYHKPELIHGGPIADVLSGKKKVRPDTPAQEGFDYNKAFPQAAKVVDNVAAALVGAVVAKGAQEVKERIEDIGQKRQTEPSLPAPAPETGSQHSSQQEAPPQQAASEARPSWKKEPWSRLSSRLDQHVSRKRSLDDKDVSDDIATRNDAVFEASQDNFLEGAYREIGNQMGQININTDPDYLRLKGLSRDSEVERAWELTGQAIANLNPNWLEEQALGQFDEKTHKEFKRQYGGMHEAYQRVLTHRREKALMDAEVAAGIRDPDDPVLKEAIRKDAILGFGQVPGTLRALASEYAQVEKRQIIEATAHQSEKLAGMEGYGGGFRRPEDPLLVPERNPGIGPITEKTIDMWGMPRFFLVQPQGELGVWVRINTANVFNQIMDIGTSPYEQAMWGSQEFSKLPESKIVVAVLGLPPILKLCSDPSRKIGDLVGAENVPGKLKTYGVNETLTAKFLLLSENDLTQKVLGVFEVLGGNKNADEAGYSDELKQFIEDNRHAFVGLRTALRAQDLDEQKKKLIAISDKVAKKLDVDSGLARICLEFYELFGEPGLNYDLGRLRQFYYDGRAGYPTIIKTLPLDQEVMEKDKKSRLEDLKNAIKDDELVISQSPDEAERIRREREIIQLRLEIEKTGKEDVGGYISEKTQRIRLARLKTLRGEGVQEGGYLKDKKAVLTSTTQEIQAEDDKVKKSSLRQRAEKLKTEITILQAEVNLIQDDTSGPQHIRRWANDIINRYQGDGLYSFLGMVDGNGNTLEDWESEAIGILNKPLYLRAEEETMKDLRTKMSGVIMEKGALSLAEGLAKGGTRVMLEMVSRFGTSKIQGNWEAEAAILSTFDKTAGMAQRRDQEYATTPESDLLAEMRKNMAKLRVRPPFTLVTQDTFNKMMTLRVVPPVTQKEEALYLRNQEEAATRDALLRQPKPWAGFRGWLASLIPKI